MIAEFHPLADQELADAALFYEAQAPLLGADFLDDVERMVEVLCHYPELGRLTEETVRTLATRRFPYVIIYQVFAERVCILAIAHQRRRPKYWSGRSGSPG